MIHAFATLAGSF